MEKEEIILTARPVIQIIKGTIIKISMVSLGLFLLFLISFWGELGDKSWFILYFLVFLGFDVFISGMLSLLYLFLLQYNKIILKDNLFTLEKRFLNKKIIFLRFDIKEVKINFARIGYLCFIRLKDDKKIFIWDTGFDAQSWEIWKKNLKII